MKVGIFSDIHGNIEALDVVLGVMKKEGVSEYLCCGDVVGYGPDPAACIGRLRDLRLTAVAGNHDFGVLGRTPASEFNRAAQKALAWTAEHVLEDEMAFLDSLSLVDRFATLLLVHGSPSAPEQWEYVFSVREAREEMRFFSEPCCIVGHSHYPFAVERRNGNDVHLIGHPEFELKPDCKYLVNAGSVGQPRDGDPRACCLVYDTESRVMAFHRVEYDIAAVQQKIFNVGLPDFLATRLAVGR